MKKWQRYWLYVVIIYSSIHLIRDISQDLGINYFLSTPFVKTPPIQPSGYASIFNTYVIAIIEIGLTLYCLKKNSFGKVGYTTTLIAIGVLVGWLYYWFFL